MRRKKGKNELLSATPPAGLDINAEENERISPTFVQAY